MKKIDDLLKYKNCSKSRVNHIDNLKETFAHEMGHSIIWAYRGKHQSLTHEGSSTALQNVNGSYNYPATGELDLNKYSGTDAPADFFERVVANEVDVKGLLWLSRLEAD